MREVKNEKTSRMVFGDIKEVVEMPNLIQVQKDSYNWFVNKGLKDVFNECFPITDYSGKLVLDFVDYHFNDGTWWLRMIFTNYGETFPFIPLVGLLSNIGASCWMVIILNSYLFTKKNKKYILVLIPLYLSILICIAGPANAYFRYVMPYMFVLPILTCLLINKIKESNNEEK
jgi:hypothetical protein